MLNLSDRTLAQIAIAISMIAIVPGAIQVYHTLVLSRQEQLALVDHGVTARAADDVETAGSVSLIGNASITNNSSVPVALLEARCRARGPTDAEGPCEIALLSPSPVTMHPGESTPMEVRLLVSPHPEVSGVPQSRDMIRSWVASYDSERFRGAGNIIVAISATTSRGWLDLGYLWVDLTPEPAAR